MRRLATAILATGLAVVILAGCGGSSSPSTSTNGSSPGASGAGSSTGKGSSPSHSSTKAILSLPPSGTAPFHPFFQSNQLTLSFSPSIPPSIKGEVLGSIVLVACKDSEGEHIKTYAPWANGYGSVILEVPGVPPYSECEMSVQGHPLGTLRD